MNVCFVINLIANNPNNHNIPNEQVIYDSQGKAIDSDLDRATEQKFNSLLAGCDTLRASRDKNHPDHQASAGADGVRLTLPQSADLKTLSLAGSSNNPDNNMHTNSLIAHGMRKYLGFS